MTEREQVERPRKRGVAKWAWRGLAGLGIIATLLVVGFWIWDWRVERQFHARVKEIHDSGEPIYAEDFATPEPAAGTNAVDDWLAAGSVAEREDEASQAASELTLPAPPLAEEEVKVISAYVDGRREVFGLVESAVGKPAVWWRIDWSQPTIFQDLPGTRSFRAIGNVLRMDALLALHRGDQRRALARVRQLEALGRAIDRQSNIVGHLIGIGLQAMAAEVVEWVAPDLKLDPGGGGGVTPAEVRAVIDELLDDGPLRAGMIDALRGERKDQWIIVDAMVSGKPITTGSKPIAALKRGALVRPFFHADGELMLRLMTGLIRQFEATGDWPGFQSGGEYRSMYAEIQAGSVRHVMARMLTPTLDKAVQAHYRCVADRRLAAVALAAGWYAAEHGGRLAATLGELVPKYLPAIPMDPMSAGGAVPLRYRGAGENPVVYSVGTDGVDDGGEGLRVEELFDRWRGRDAVMHLRRQARYREAGQ
jgi:hypothetical protein